jgi:hypothetical protein
VSGWEMWAHPHIWTHRVRELGTNRLQDIPNPVRSPALHLSRLIRRRLRHMADMREFRTPYELAAIDFFPSMLLDVQSGGELLATIGLGFSILGNG